MPTTSARTGTNQRSCSATFSATDHYRFIVRPGNCLSGGNRYFMFGRSSNMRTTLGQQGQCCMRMVQGVAPQTGQIAAIWLRNQPFVVQTPGGGNHFDIGRVGVNLEALLIGHQVEANQYIQFFEQFRRVGHGQTFQWLERC